MFQLLKLLMTVARTAVHPGAMRMAMARAGLFILAMLIAVALGIGGVGFGLYAAFRYLEPMIGPAAAAAIIAAAMLTAAAGLAAIAWHRISAPRQRRKGTNGGAPAAEDGLHSLVRLLDRWARANPWEATAAALTIGFAIGSRR